MLFNNFGPYGTDYANAEGARIDKRIAAGNGPANGSGTRFFSPGLPAISSRPRTVYDAERSIDAQMAQDRNVMPSQPTAEQMMRQIMQSQGNRPPAPVAPSNQAAPNPMLPYGPPPSADEIMRQIMQANGQYGQEQRFRPAPAPAPAAPATPAPVGNVPLPPVRDGGSQMPGATPNGFQLNEQQQAQMKAYADQFTGGDMSKVNTRLIRGEDGNYMPDFYAKGLLSGFFGGQQ